MPDISMCHGSVIRIEGGRVVRDLTEVCPSRDSCYRYTATPSDRQSFGVFHKPGQTKCEYYCSDRNKSD